LILTHQLPILKFNSIDNIDNNEMKIQNILWFSCQLLVLQYNELQVN